MPEVQPKSGAAASARAAQEFVPIKEVRDGVVILKDGNIRMALMASSINLALKSADEQTAVIAQFQDFLNSLEFSVQFFVESRKLDIRPYVAILEDRLAQEIDDLLKLQIREYIAFIRDFTDRANIMSKNFFIVVPYDPSLVARSGTKGALVSLLPGKKADDLTLTDEQFGEYRVQLEQRVGVIEQGLIRTGVRVAVLGTEEVIELFYKLFNPGELEKPLMPAGAR
ncbi:MAG: TraC family protein [Minisyncoccia bacterium]